MVLPGHATTSTPDKLSSIEIIKRQRSCRRLLFGAPDKEELNEWLARNSNNSVQEQRSRWNFDFEHGVPLNSSNGAQSSSSSTYEYERLDEKTVPHFYRSAPTRHKIIRPNNYNLHLNGHSENKTKEIKRTKSTPAIIPKKLTSKESNSVIKSPKKKSPSKSSSKGKPSNKKFNHFPSTKVF